MFESEVNAQKGSFPNIVYKRKLAPLPLFKQNQPPKPFFAETTKEKSFFGFHQSSAKSLPNSPMKTFQSEFSTVNNYGRLCDQPFLEFSSFHFEQVFGSGGGKKKLILEPIDKKKQKHAMNRLTTIRDYSEYMRASAIRSEDAMRFSLSPKVMPHKENKEVDKQKKVKENQTVIKKVYNIGEYEAEIGFYSLEVVLTPQEGENKAPVSIRIGQRDLKKIYKYTPAQIMKIVLESTTLQEGKIKIDIKKDKEVKSGSSIGEDTYPEKKDNLVVTLDGKNYGVTIYYPYLQVSIAKLDYKEKLMLKPLYLSNLYEEKFNNLRDYIQRFSIPTQVYKNKKEIHQDELKKLPSIIKKVIKTPDFGGLMLFKSLEVHLKNTSELEPQTMMHESTFSPMTRNIMKRKKKDVNDVVLRLDIDDLDKIYKCTVQELVDLMKESIIVQEEKGFVIKFDDENINAFQHRHESEQEEFPEVSERFQMRFNKFLYECYIKFPTLELYVPETNFKDVIQLKSSQLKDLIGNSFNNMSDYLSYFKKPASAKTNSIPLIRVQEAVSDEVPSKDLSQTAESTELL